MLATNFDFSSVPSSATIDGFVVEIDESESAINDNVSDQNIQLIKGGTPTGDNKATVTEWPSPDGTTYVSYGTGTTDKWNICPSGCTGADLTNDTNFGVEIQAQAAAGVSVTAQVDHVRMTVYYTTVASTTTTTAELYNTTDAETVTNSTVSYSTDTNWTRVRSAALTIGTAAGNLKSAKNYETRFKTSASTGSIANAKVIISQNAAGGINNLETYHEYANSATTNGDSTASFGFNNIYNSANWVGGTLTYYHEATSRVSTGNNTPTVDLTPGSIGTLNPSGSGGFNVNTAFSTTSQAQVPQIGGGRGTRDGGVTTATIGSSSYIYVAGGFDASNNRSTVFKSTINGTTGDAGTFDTTSQGQLPQILSQIGIAKAIISSSPYLYIIGGCPLSTCLTEVSTVYKSALNTTTGNAGTFDTASQAQLPQKMRHPIPIVATVGSSTYLYVLGGCPGTDTLNACTGTLSTVYKSTLDSSGNAGTFDTASQAQLPAARRRFPPAITLIGSTYYVYIIGGTTDPSSQTTVYKASLDANGDMAAFATTSQAQRLIKTRETTADFLTSGGTTYLYTIGGYDDANRFSTVYLSTLDTSGNIQAFSTTGQKQLPVELFQGRSATSTIGSSTYIYVIGGNTLADTVKSTVYKATVGSTYQLQRSSTITPSDASVYDTQIQNATVSNSWLVIKITSLSVPENLVMLMPFGLLLPLIIKKYKNLRSARNR